MIHCRPIRRIFYNQENGYTVAEYITEDELPSKVVEQSKDKSGRFTAFGTELPISNGLRLELDGEWKDVKHGLQFAVSYYSVDIPETEAGIQAYLSSNLIKGIGPVTAERIVTRFGKSTFYILSNTPEKLLDIPGISESRLEEILDGYHKSTQLRKLMVYLSPLGVTQGKVIKIQEHFGAAAYKILKENPYRLCEIKGFAFATVDPIARRSNNFKYDDPLRIKAAIEYILQLAQNEGHLYLSSQEIVEQVTRLLNKDQSLECISSGAIKDAGNDMIHTDGKLVGNAGGIYLRHNFNAEMGAAAELVRLYLQKNMVIKVEHLLLQAEKEEGIVLEKKQREAVIKAFQHPVTIVTGGPGTGKTTLIRVIIRVQELLNRDAMILLCAPTGRARRRMYESTGYPAMTIQKVCGMTGVAGEEAWNDYERIADDLIIADEFGMCDMYLADRFFGCIEMGARLVLVGDVNQLESVGPGNVFREMIDSGVIPVTILEACFRQEEESSIVENGERINKNQTRLVYDDSFRFYRARNPEEASEVIQKIYEKKLRENNWNVDDVQVLSPMKKETAACSDVLNPVLREIANPKRRSLIEIKNGQSLYREGDKVMQTKNMDEVANGDIGTVLNIYREEGQNKIRIDFGEDRIVEYSDDEFWPLMHAYAISIHKSQGNEYNTVIIPMLSCFKGMLRRNILYTGVTRAAHEVILVGSHDAIIRAIHNNKSAKRNTRFAFRLRLLLEAMQSEDRKSA